MFATKELSQYTKLARQRYFDYLDQKKTEKKRKRKGEKRKVVEEKLNELRRKAKCIEESINFLDENAEKAEQLHSVPHITQLNSLHKKRKS